jgi:hypothetical protein
MVRVEGRGILTGDTDTARRSRGLKVIENHPPSQLGSCCALWATYFPLWMGHSKCLLQVLSGHCLPMSGVFFLWTPRFTWHTSNHQKI